MQLSPALAGPAATYPFVAPQQAKSERLARGVEVDGLRHRRAARGDAGVHPRRARGRDRAAVDRTRPPTACPSCARRSPRWAGRRFGAALDPDTEVVPTLGSKEAIFHLAQVVGPATRSPSRRPATRCSSAARCSPAARSSSCRCSPSAASCPTSTRVPDWDDARDPVAQLPEQPDGARPPRSSFYERAAALAREHDFVARVRRGVLRDLLRRRAARARRSQLADRTNVVVVQHAVQALVDARLPLRLRRGRPARSIARAQALPPERRRRAAGVRPARRGRRLGRRGARRRGARAATAPSATSLLPALEALGMRNAGGDASFFLWLGCRTATPSEAFAAGLLEPRRPGRTRRLLRPRRRGLCAVALVPTLDECERAARATGWRVARRSGRPRCRNAGAPRPRRCAVAAEQQVVARR